MKHCNQRPIIYGYSDEINESSAFVYSLTNDGEETEMRVLNSLFLYNCYENEHYNSTCMSSKNNFCFYEKTNLYNTC